MTARWAEKTVGEMRLLQRFWPDGPAEMAAKTPSKPTDSSVFNHSKKHLKTVEMPAILNLKMKKTGLLLFQKLEKGKLKTNQPTPENTF